ncbi:MAG TPA: hypothetical protein PK112_04285, partial [candidate division Zixibacteria bacterium]|nr:hypothetical protein [candidate division Zixibacteria bacterium]
FQPLSDGSVYLSFLDSTLWYRIIPALLGVMMWTRFSKNYQWVSRWPMSMYIGIAVGVSIPLDLGNRVIRQLQATMYDFKWDTWGDFIGSSNLFYVLDPFSGLSQVIIAVGSIAGLTYFFFSKAHTGVFGRVATFGIWILMIGFGASFGFTVMARISLFINRVQDVDSWRKVGWNAGETPIEGYSAWYQLVGWLLVAVVVAYIVNEIRLYLKSRNQVAGPQV